MRHARRNGQPRRSWAPLDPDFPRTLPVIVLMPRVVDAEMVQHLRNRFGLELWEATRATYGVSEAVVRLAPRLGRAS